jgi:hypothetical protein
VARFVKKNNENSGYGKAGKFFFVPDKGLLTAEE